MIELTEFKSEWSDLFNRFKDAVFDSHNGIVKEIQHIGSTSIDDAKAKDIIDVQIGVLSLDNIDGLQSRLEDLGFEYLALIKQDHVPFHDFDYFENGWEKRFFKGEYQGQAFNVHIRIWNNTNWNFAINFIRYLKSNEEAKYAFMQFKQRLASAGVSRQDYCLIKDSVIDLMSLQFM